MSESYEEIARSSHPRILLETSLARLAEAGPLLPAADLVARLEALSKGSPEGTGGRGGGGGPTSKVTSEPPRPAAQARSDGPDVSRDVRAEPDTPRAGNDGSGAVGDLVEQWPRLLDELTRRSAPTASIFERGVPEVGSGADQLVIRFDPRDRFAADAADNRERRLDLEQLLSEITGIRARVTIEVGALGSLPAAARKRLEAQEQRRTREDEARAHPLVRDALREFGASIARVTVTSEPDDTMN
jgi:hypothetical protein